MAPFGVQAQAADPAPSVPTAPAASASSPAPAAQRVEVIGTSPLPGQGVDRSLLPYQTQLMRRSGLDAAQAGTTTDLLARRMAGTQTNDIQGSPYQSDLTFRGYRASGLLGSAQGLSVYLDGVRINEPFGDVVFWDLVPEFALSTVALVPGANPAYGLNTLGGAIAMTTLDGRSAPGARGEISVGQFGRRSAHAMHGGVGGEGGDAWQHYVGLSHHTEQGWRAFSQGRVSTVVAKVGRRFGQGPESADLTVSMLGADSRLAGNGLVPWSTHDASGARTADLGAADRSAVYTHPDQTRNRLAQASVAWRQSLSDSTTVEVLLHTRRSRRQTISGDEADAEDGVAPPADENAAFNRSSTRQQSHGLSAAVSSVQGAHRWQVGLSLERANTRFEQTEQEAAFDSTRGVVAGLEDAELSARVLGRSTVWGLHATDTLRVGPDTHITATARWNQATVANTLTSVDDDTNLLQARPRERFRYSSLNPALGVAHRITPIVTLTANMARNARAPTVIELGCADPNEPCRLPTGLQADPYLKAVRSTAVEVGARVALAPGLSGAFTAYRNDNRDDIVFSSVSVTGQRGYFRNFDRTRHQGLDLEARWTQGVVDASATYSFLDATYQADGTLRVGERNVVVRPGTRIAGLPRHHMKLALDVRVLEALSVGSDMQWVGRRTSAGNEDGRFLNDSPNAGDFGVPSHALLNLRLSFKPKAAQAMEWFARVNNVLDRRYATYGALASTRFDAGGAYTGEPRPAWFVGLGAPRSTTVGLRVRF